MEKIFAVASAGERDIEALLERKRGLRSAGVRAFNHAEKHDIALVALEYGRIPASDVMAEVGILADTFQQHRLDELGLLSSDQGNNPYGAPGHCGIGNNVRNFINDGLGRPEFPMMGEILSPESRR